MDEFLDVLGAYGRSFVRVLVLSALCIQPALGKSLTVGPIGLLTDILATDERLWCLGSDDQGSFVAKIEDPFGPFEKDKLSYSHFQDRGATTVFTQARDGSIWFGAGFDSIGKIDSDGTIETMQLSELPSPLHGIVVREQDILVTTPDTYKLIAYKREDLSMIGTIDTGGCGPVLGTPGVDGVAWFSSPDCKAVLQVDRELRVVRFDVAMKPAEIALSPSGELGLLQPFPWKLGIVTEPGHVKHFRSIRDSSGLQFGEVRADPIEGFWFSNPYGTTLGRWSGGALTEIVFGIGADLFSVSAKSLWLSLGEDVFGFSRPLVPGDCNDNLEVRIDELVQCVSIGLGNDRIESCGACDLDEEGSVSIADLVGVVNSTLQLQPFRAIKRF